MADVEKKVLLDVQIKATEALKNLAQLKIQIDDLKSNQQALKVAMNDTNTSTAEGVAQYEQIRKAYEKQDRKLKH